MIAGELYWLFLYSKIDYQMIFFLPYIMCIKSIIDFIKHSIATLLFTIIHYILYELVTDLNYTSLPKFYPPLLMTTFDTLYLSYFLCIFGFY